MNDYEVIIKEIDGQVRNLEEHLGIGNLKDFAEYQNICGRHCQVGSLAGALS